MTDRWTAQWHLKIMSVTSRGVDYFYRSGGGTCLIDDIVGFALVWSPWNTPEDTICGCFERSSGWQESEDNGIVLGSARRFSEFAACTEFKAHFPQNFTWTVASDFRGR